MILKKYYFCLSEYVNLAFCPQKPHLGEPHPRVGVLVINR